MQKVKYFFLFLLTLTIINDEVRAQVKTANQLPAVCGPNAINNLRYSDSAIKNSLISKQIRTHLMNKKMVVRPALENKNNQQFSLNDIQLQVDSSGYYILPTVFHIVNSDPESITDEMIKKALADVNDAFAHIGNYGVDTNGIDTKIRFCLAQTHPEGGITSGITRTKSFYENNDMELEAFKTAALNYWDPAKYVNIWVVNSIQGEIQPSSFFCGNWQRAGIGGYAAAGVGAVVGGLSTPLMAHELGHYLSLLHTFAGGCANGDCSLEGDLVCDTPPDQSTNGSPCNDPENSCSTDTLSGPFKVDVRDNISNFMDYGSPCPTVFTPGQAERMRAFLEIFNEGSLIKSDKCIVPCSDSAIANFNWDSNLYPIIGDSVNFSNTSIKGTHFRWYVDSVLIDTSFNFGYRFNAAGSFQVMLRVFNENELCFSSYTGNVIINCGVVSRFSPTERIISSQKDVYSDPVRFWNKSHGAIAYKWFVTNNTIGSREMVSSDIDLIYDFPQPGTYSIQLEASNGNCISLSPTFVMPVEDPTPDAVLSFLEVDCYKKDSIRVVMKISNLGFDTIPSKLPVTFYDRDPKSPGAIKLQDTYITTDFVIGKCEIIFTHIVAASRPRLDTLFAVLDEQITINEKSYANNTTGIQGFQFRVRVTPKEQLVYTNTRQTLNLESHKGPPTNIRWTSIPAPSCTNCSSPSFQIIDTTIIQGYAENIYACPDSASAVINVIPLDAVLSLDEIFCYKNDSLLINGSVCLKNNYNSLKKDLKLTYFSLDSASVNKKLLGELLIPANTVFSDSCYDFSHIIKMTDQGKIVAYLNRDLIQYEDSTRNNTDSVPYIPFDISFPLPTIKVFRGEPTRLNFNRQGDPIVNLIWTPSSTLNCNNCPTPILKTNVNQVLKLNANTKYQCTDSAYLEIFAFYQARFKLPNVFTPNGDGLNDYFYLIAADDIKNIKVLQVLNRWGEIVFETKNARPNDLAFAWNGTKKGKDLPQGTYVYYLVFELTDGTTESHKGNITLIR
jgi:gliding motility-associated-like protein